MTGIHWLLCCLTICNVVGLGISTFKFASYYTDHMVLQHGAGGAIVWGTSSHIGDTVQLFLNGHKVFDDVVTFNESGVMTWIAKVAVTNDNYGPYTLSAKSSEGTITLHDVMFGDVWVCSDQSNMEFTMYGLTNASAELAEASNYSDIRLFQAKHSLASVALHDFNLTATSQWSVPNQGNLVGFSAVCWLFGKQLSSQFKYPIGLIESNWGGTKIEWWSSTSALSKCSHQVKRVIHNSDLWNAMMNPLTRNTIYGVIWYQGEANLATSDLYSCQFPAMINDWRQRFSSASLHTTSAEFPFGFVQLAPNAPETIAKGFPALRWAQTAGYGKVPNPKMPNTFMSVALDLPDFKSPYGSIHPRYKHDVASRLVLSALGVAYHQSGLDYEGPYPSDYHLSSHTLNIEYDQGRTPIRVDALSSNFEVCCAARICDKNFDNWKAATIEAYDISSVTLNTTQCDQMTVSAVRYAWQESPCAFKQCAVYGRETDLPGPPFFHSFL
ncbi:sialate O-acetylesterase-like [Ylistrum balloti]|uniref:sialate O-acetylesterase-like n=1 Tax=Ylistrum balloti TaxID=509963 RepID=UPI002905C6E5|nr:sialate O-acetylesterase-like [Ylistrum balloti]